MGAVVATAAPAGCAKVATAAAALAPTPVTLDIQAGTQAVIAIVDASVVWACKCGTEDVSTKRQRWNQHLSQTACRGQLRYCTVGSGLGCTASVNPTEHTPVDGIVISHPWVSFPARLGSAAVRETVRLTPCMQGIAATVDPRTTLGHLPTDSLSPSVFSLASRCAAAIHTFTSEYFFRQR